MAEYNQKDLLSSGERIDIQSFEELFHLYYQRLFLYASKFVGEDTANDILQDTFYTFWQNRQEIRIIKSVSSYLFVTVRNHCYHYLKRQKRNGVFIGLEVEELNFFQDSGESILQFDLEDRIEELFDSLPPRSREVFVLSRKKGLTNKEIAERLQISVKAVEKHITTSLKHFKGSLQGSNPELFVVISIFFF